MRWLALWLTLFISAIFVIQVIFPPLTEDFLLISSDVYERPWILVTPIFLHGDITHLLYNMLALATFGSILEKSIGERKFLFVFFITGLISSIASTFLYTSVLGASGAVFGVIGALALLRPRMVVWALGVPMPMVVAAAAWSTLDIIGLFSPSGIANLGHLGGLFAGLVIGLYWKKKYPESKKRKSEKILKDEDVDEWEKHYMKK